MPNRFSRFASIMVLTSSLALTPCQAQQANPLPVEEAIRENSFTGVSPIEFSPDGKWLAYVVEGHERVKLVGEGATGRSGVPGDTRGKDIWVLNVETGEARNLTGEKGNNWLAKWSPDGHFVAFVSDRDGSGQTRLWVWDKTKNNLRKLADTSLSTAGAAQIEWTPDSRSIFVTVVPEDLSVLDPQTEKGRFSTNGQKDVVERVKGSTVRLYRSSAAGQDDKEGPKSDPWNLNRTLRDLARINVLTGEATVVVKGHRIETYRLSPDGSRVAYTASERFERAGNGQTLFDLVTVTLATSQERVIASDIRLNIDAAQFSWSPDGALISYHTGGWDVGMIADCYIISANGGSLRNVTKFSPQMQADLAIPSIPLWDKSGNYIYFVKDGDLWQAAVRQEKALRIARIPDHQIRGRLIPQFNSVLWTIDDGRSTIVVTHDNVGKQDGFYKINLTNGEISELLEKGQCYTCGRHSDPVAVTRDGQNIAYLAEDAQHGSDLWLSDASLKNPRRVTHLNPHFERYKLGGARLIDWLSDDGERLHGALILPPNYKEGMRYPLIVGVYGGAFQSNAFDHFGFAYAVPMNMQLLATRGYAVLLPDSPSHEATPMADLAKTVLPGVNKVIDSGIADPERLGIMGHSNGGYSTLALIVQTKRFKAAVEMGGAGDLAGFYGEMNKDGDAYATTVLEHNQNVMGGTPWRFRDRYIENSPFFYLDRVETPLLIVHGAEDDAVAPFLGDQIFVALRRLGKEVEYAKYEGEGHVPTSWSYANQVDFCSRTLAWFDKYLKAGPTEERSSSKSPLP